MNTKSIVHSTMLKITFLIFCIMILLHFVINQLYWDNEGLKKELELLEIASSLEMDIQNKGDLISNIKNNSGDREVS